MYSKVFLIYLIVFTINNQVSAEATIKFTVNVDEIKDESVIINVTGPSELEETKFGSIRVINQLLIDQQSTNDLNKTKVKGNMKRQILNEIKKGDYFFQQMKLINLKPNQRYLINLIAIYGNKSLTIDLIDLTTKSKSPININNQQIFMKFDGIDVVNYYAQIQRIKSSNLNQETNCILEIKLSPCFGSQLQLPNDLKDGEKYLIKIWYIDSKGQQSEPKTIEHFWDD